MILFAHTKQPDIISARGSIAPLRSSWRDFYGKGLAGVVFFVVLGILLLFGLSRVHAATQYSAYPKAAYSGYISVPFADNLKLQSFSFDFWWKPMIDIGGGTQFIVGGLWSQSVGWSAWSLEWYPTGYGQGNDRKIGYYDPKDGGWKFYTGTQFTINNWYHIVFTKDGGNCKIYTNGALDGQGACASIVYAAPYFGFNVPPSMTLQGTYKFDEARYWSKVLMLSDVQNLYNAGSGFCFPFGYTVDGLVSGWHFDEGTGTTASDWQDGNNGTLNGAVDWDAENKVSCAPPVPVCDASHCNLCLTENTCKAACGADRWWENFCHDVGFYDCQYENKPGLTYGQCQAAGYMWLCEFEEMVDCCSRQYDCVYTPYLPPIPHETQAPTSTIQFVYSDFTDKWPGPTALFAPVFNWLGNIVNPILTWGNKFSSLFSVQTAKSNADSLAGSVATIISFTHAFNNIFGSLPIFEGVFILIAVLIVKTFYNIIIKVIGIIRG